MAKPTKHHGKWRIRWIDENKSRKSAVFDDFKTACYELNRRQAQVEEIRQGLRLPTRPNKTFGEVCDYWLSHRLPQKRSPKDDHSIIKTHLRPNFGSLKLTEITVEKVDRFVSERAHLNKKTISNHLTLLISLLRLAVDLKWLASVPNIKKPKIILFSNDYRYLRTEGEIHRFLTAAKEESETAFLLYASAIYTGMRAGELAALRFSDIRFNGDQSLITIQNSFNGPTKSAKTRYIPLLAPLYPLLINQRKQVGGDLVFPNRDGNMYTESGRIFQEVLHRTLDRAGFLKVLHSGKLKRYIVFHDLRHTFASHWVMKGGDIFKLQHILGHSDIKMTLRYAHLAPHAFKEDFELLGKSNLIGLTQTVPTHSN